LQACDLDPASVKRRRADVSLQVKSRRRNFGKQKTAYPVEYPGRKNRSRAPNIALPNCDPPHRTESKIQLRTPSNPFQFVTWPWRDSVPPCAPHRKSRGA
jgi:hypothetical protein